MPRSNINTLLERDTPARTAAKPISPEALAYYLPGAAKMAAEIILARRVRILRGGFKDDEGTATEGRYGTLTITTDSGLTLAGYREKDIMELPA